MSKIPAATLNDHVAIVGKTGAGKTSTAKLAIEQLVAAGERVCVLDPIKSDFWGLTSSADGKHGGLPFSILGGPRGHVPLFSSAGKAIAEVVASGALKLSILDMADFEPGGQNKFFIDFAEILLRKMKGRVTLVLEEAHEFAPKERSGLQGEPMAIHWAKKLATAGRTKGVRLLVLTQRTQALHNALLGGCETLIAHRLTAPADQAPVILWLNQKLTKEKRVEVEQSISSLKTGEAWVCSDKNGIFERIQFPRIKTYDNTTAPTGETDAQEVKTASVDHDALRAIVGDAVKEAEDNDPKLLRKKVATLESEIRHLKFGLEDARRALDTAKASKVTETKEVSVLTDLDRDALQQVADLALNDRLSMVEGLLKHIRTDIDLNAEGARIAMAKASSVQPHRAAPAPLLKSSRPVEAIRTTAVKAGGAARVASPATSGDLKGPEQRVLNALAELEAIGARDPERVLVAFFSGYSNLGSKGFRNALGALSSGGLISYPKDGYVAITSAGRERAEPAETPATPKELQDRVVRMLGGASERLLRPLIDAYPESIDRQELASSAGYGNMGSKGFRNAIGRLSSLGFISYPERGRVAAQPVLFLESE